MTTVWGPIVYPVSLDTFAPALIDNVDEVIANHPNSLSTALKAIETKLGIDNSPAIGLGGVSFHTIGKAANPGALGAPTIWVDNSGGPGFGLWYTDDTGAAFDLLAAAGSGTAVADWAPTTVYVLTQEVLHVGLRFRCISAHTSGLTFFNDVDLSKWECVSGEGFIVNQLAHGLVAQDVVYSTLGVWAKADASDPTKLTDPPVLVLGVGTNYFLGAQDQIVTITAHGLTVDQVYFLSEIVPGLLTLTEPSGVGEYSCPVLRVLSANTVSVLPYRPSEVGPGYWSQLGNILFPTTTANTLQVGVGTVANPGYAFYTDADTGMYQDVASFGADSLSFACGGNPFFVCSPNGPLGFAVFGGQTNIGTPLFCSILRYDAHGSAVDAGGLAVSGLTSTAAVVSYSTISTYVLDWTNGSHTSQLEFDIADGAGAAVAVTMMTLSPTELRVSTGDVVLEDTTNVVESELKVAANNDVDTGTETVDSFDPDEDGACFWHYFVKKVGSLRAGTVKSVWDDSAGTTEYTEDSTLDIGDTSDLVFAVDMSGATGSVRLRATAASDDWIVKVVRIRLEGTI